MIKEITLWILSQFDSFYQKKWINFLKKIEILHHEVHEVFFEKIPLLRPYYTITLARTWWAGSRGLEILLPPKPK